MQKIMAIGLASSILLSGCAHNFVESYEPVIDTKNVDPSKYQADLQECRAFAVREDPVRKAAEGAVAGALVGALLGAAIGSAYHQTGYGARIGAVQGAASGGIYAGLTAAQAQQLIVRNCMAERGYAILY